MLIFCNIIKNMLILFKNIIYNIILVCTNSSLYIITYNRWYCLVPRRPAVLERHIPWRTGLFKKSHYPRFSVKKFRLKILFCFFPKNLFIFDKFIYAHKSSKSPRIDFQAPKSHIFHEFRHEISGLKFFVFFSKHCLF